jgi:hypothetical protein
MLSTFVKRLTIWINRNFPSQTEQWLATATDIAELERRMRHLERAR